MALPARRAFVVHTAALLAGCASPAARTLPALHSARFVLLGELHDNPEHHRARAQLLRELLADGRPTRVLFEQMAQGTEAAIAEAPRDAEAVASAGRLDRKAWQWPLHRPIVEAALAGGATLAGANLERDALRPVMREGLAAVPAALRPWLEDARWTAAQQAVLESVIEHGHCGLLPRRQWQPMVLAQRTRDAAMARALLDTPAGQRAVLIAGNGHVRRDVGVPWYLERAGVEPGEIVSLGFVERGTEAAALPGAAFDSVQAAPPAPRDDPCAPLRGRSG
jgi:uncharacterized iron-regulated protein